MKKAIQTYEIDIDLYGIDTMTIKARSKREAKKKAISRLKQSLAKYIDHVYIEKIKPLEVLF